MGSYHCSIASKGMADMNLQFGVLAYFVFGFGFWCWFCVDGVVRWVVLFCFKNFNLQIERPLGEARLAIHVAGNRGKLHITETKEKGVQSSDSFN